MPIHQNVTYDSYPEFIVIQHGSEKSYEVIEEEIAHFIDHDLGVTAPIEAKIRAAIIELDQDTGALTYFNQYRDTKKKTLRGYGNDENVIEVLPDMLCIQRNRTEALGSLEEAKEEMRKKLPSAFVEVLEKFNEKLASVAAEIRETGVSEDSKLLHPKEQAKQKGATPPPDSGSLIDKPEIVGYAAKEADREPKK